MTANDTNHDLQSNSKTVQTVPAFKPVALPALAAAMRSAKHQTEKAKTSQPPAILRKEAVLDR
ncbi:hypothetical protein [Microvirga solisilvae]|uniref:hypothetical protein n=1 Tax=Microvirga solisilvae TaxID=2919498 RepID=UPI001FAEA99F|nr:hypothetical protein [Microvirga solisilvae]